MKLIMKNGFLAVKELPKEKQTAFGIVIPDGMEEDKDFQTSKCEVTDVSEGSTYKQGDIVLFSKLVPDDIMIKQKDGTKINLWFVREDDIKAVIKE